MAFFCTIYKSDLDFPYKILFVKEIELEYVGLKFEFIYLTVFLTSQRG